MIWIKDNKVLLSFGDGDVFMDIGEVSGINNCNKRKAVLLLQIESGPIGKFSVTKRESPVDKEGWSLSKENKNFIIIEAKNKKSIESLINVLSAYRDELDNG